MPIQLNYTNPDTAENWPVSYWFINYAHVDPILSIVQFDVNGYITLAAKNGGKRQFYTKSVVATFAQLGLTVGSTLAQFANALYPYAIANDPFFSGGSIV